VSDTETDPSYRMRRERARIEGYRAILAVPLNTQYAPPTALLVFHPTPHVFTHNEIQLLTSFANHAAMAIENAMLYERSDMRLREQTHRLEALVQSLHDGLILGDLQGTVIYANKRVAQLSDLSTKMLAGMHVDRILARIIAKTSEAANKKNDLQKILNKKGERMVEISQSQADRTTYLRLEVFNVNDEEGLPIGRGIFFHDITADRELDRMRASLVSTVSHELRTPLAAIKGYASTMLAEDVEWDRASQHEFLTIISDESDRLTSLVNNLLDLSRIEAGSLKLSHEKCDIQETVNSAAKQAHLTAVNSFELQTETGLPKLYADPPRLETILRNLIENAVKYGGESAKIRVEVCRQGNDFLFRVIDDGPGIPEKERQYIFESFYRVDDSLARLTSGAGLGLAICQGLVRAHGGKIWAESREVGACIAFTIPVKKAPSSGHHKRSGKPVHS
jgi:PAS domain S-box-containing protein